MLAAEGEGRKGAIVAALLGGVVLARAVQDPQLSDEILKSVRQSSADRAVANPNVARRSCDLEDEVRESSIWKLFYQLSPTKALRWTATSRQDRNARYT